MTRRLLWVLLPLLLVACSEDSSTVQPPVPLTPDEQVVADARAIRDALETYAAAHGGTYGEYDIDLSEIGITGLTNPYTGKCNPAGAVALSSGEIGILGYNSCDGTVLGYRIIGYRKNDPPIVLENLEHVPVDVRYLTDVTVANALLVRDAALRFAAANGGVFPTDVAGDTDPNGKYLMDYLPGGELLINPADAVQSNPMDGVGLAIGGGVGYVGSDSGGGFMDSYLIEAYSCDGSIMLTLTNIE